MKSTLLEPLLVVAVSLFWLFTLPVTALALAAVKIWDTLRSMKPGNNRNPLILRRGAASKSLRDLMHRSPAGAAQA